MNPMLIRLIAIAIFVLSVVGISLGQSKKDGPATPLLSPSDNSALSDDVPVFANPVALNDVRKSRLPQIIRFVVTEDFPPFSFIDGGGKLQGLHPALIKALCDDIQIRCTVQVRRFDLVQAALANKNAEAALAGLPMQEDLLHTLTFTEPYYRYTGRFLARQNTDFSKDTNLSIAAVAGSAHEAYLKQFFSQHDLVAVPTREEGYTRLKDGTVDLYFGDSLDHAFWLENKDGKSCCQNFGGVLHDPRFFGQGLRIALASDQADLRDALNASLSNLQYNGVYKDLYRRFLPVDPYSDAYAPLPASLTP
jgi:polar amino acid transport system substrate-binding protein